VTTARHRLLASTEHLKLWLEFFAAGALVCEFSLLVLGSTWHQQVLLIATAAGCIAIAVVGIAIVGGESMAGRMLPSLSGLAALGIAGVVTHGLSPALGGFFVLTFVYVGLTQPAWTSVALVPLASAGWLVVNQPITHSTFARMPVAVALWILLGELLSRFSAERDRDKRMLAQQATHDALTGLRNRHGLDELLAGARGGDAVAFLDLDRFKEVNDLQGHAAGDKALADLGGVIRGSLRADDVALRYGGEEILVLLPATSADEAAVIIERLRDAWREARPDLTFSAGVATVGLEGGVEAARQADIAVYLAKERGRDRTELARREQLRLPVQATR
jgi:diguanylate cyclase (GGDEF)-like protein